MEYSEHYITLLEEENKLLKEKLVENRILISQKNKMLFSANNFHTVAIQSIFEHSVDGIALLNEHGQIQEWSSGYEKITGIANKDVVGKYVWEIIVDLIHPNEKSEKKIKTIVAEVKRTLNRQKTSTFNRKIRNKATGERKFVQAKYFPVEIHEKVLMGIICSDITNEIEKKKIILQKETQLKETEFELKSEKDRVKAVADNLPNVSLQRLEKNIKTNELKFTYLSNTWEDTTGQNIEKSLQSFDYVMGIVLPEDLEKLQNTIDKSFDELIKIDVEIRINHRTKGTRWILLGYNPRIVKNKIVSDGYSIDITERKKIETALEDHNQELELIIKKRTEQLALLNEDLITANEELSATNEELSSTNEELAVTNEELSGTNKKLETEIENKNNLMQMLENSEKTRRNFIFQAMEGIVIIEDSGTILDWNRKAEEITGISKENTVSHSLWKIIPKILIDRDTGKLYKSNRNVKKAIFEKLNIEDKQLLFRDECKIKTGSGEVKILNLSMFTIDFSINKKTYGIVFNDITEKIKNEAELENYRNHLEQMVLTKTKELTDSQERLKSLSNNLPGGVIFQLVLDTTKDSLKFSFISDTVSDIFGISSEEISKKSNLLFDLIHPDDKDFVINLKSDSSDHKFKDIENRIILKSGEMKWIHLRLLTRSIENKYTIFEGFMLDITKRKLTELELEESRNNQYILNDVLQTMHTAVDIPEAIQTVLENIGMYTNANRAYIFEKSNDNKIFQKRYEWCSQGIIPTFDNMKNFNNQIIKDWLNYFQKYGYYCAFDIKELDKIHHETLEIYKVKSILNIPIWHNEKIYGFIGFHHCIEYKEWKQTDIQLLINLSQIISTANRRFLAEKSIFMSQQTLRTVMDNINANIYVTDFDSNDILFANKKIKEQFGNNVEGKKCWKVFRNGVGVCSDCENAKLITGEGLNENGIIQYEKWFPDRNVWYSCSKSAIEWIDGRIVHMEYASDITDRKETEKELIRAKERAEEADNLKSAFLANMSHEIRTPMNGILGFASLIQLEIDEEISPRTTQYAQIMYDNCNSLLQLLDDIIDISKLESKQMKIVKTEYNINSLLSDLLILYKQLLSEKGKSKSVELIFEKSDIDEVVNVDYIRVKQIITNLVSNSIKFTDHGSIKFGFKRHEKDYLLFYVKDTGIGIPEKYKTVIFDRFRRVEEHTDKNIGGTGLGLAISKNLVEIMEGKIWCESEENVGTTFYFTVKV